MSLIQFLFPKLLLAKSKQRQIHSVHFLGITPRISVAGGNGMFETRRARWSRPVITRRLCRGEPFGVYTIYIIMTFSQSSESYFLFRDGSIVSQIKPPQGPNKILMKWSIPKGGTLICFWRYHSVWKRMWKFVKLQSP